MRAFLLEFNRIAKVSGAIQLMALQRNAHNVFRLMYHFVWIPKYRHKVFEEPYRSSLKGIIRKIGYDYNIGASD